MSFHSSKIPNSISANLSMWDVGQGRVVEGAGKEFSRNRTTTSTQDFRKFDRLEMEGTHPTTTTAGAIYQDHRGAMAGFRAILI
jgi:hypothetical protein